MNLIDLIIQTPWRAISELKMLILKPFVIFFLKLFGISIKDGSKFYGFPVFQRWQSSQIKIGRNFTNRNDFDSNPLGINHPTIISTRSKEAKIIIGDNVGISGGSICAENSIIIGSNTLIGSNCDIIDTDFHPIKYQRRLSNPNSGASKPIRIGKNVFIGTRSIILKGVSIGDNSVIAAGSVVSKNVPSNSIYIAGRIKKNEK